MAKDEKIKAAIEAALKKNPDASMDELIEVAAKVDKSVRSMPRRSFNAKYPLQVKRQLGLTKSSAKKTARKSSGGQRSGTKKSKSARSGRSGRSRATPAAPAPTPSSAGRDKIRDTFLKFASDITAAEARRDLVRVLSNVDRYVDQVMKAAK